ncbi:PucR family transcriptional regulator [Demequina capsici]|uniref:PucR family transcriptional regulator n=1 Tax=Demequina capsici TaxID=3075620 RepID=A0AA96FCF9_9MICO|nr:PucR family transcriptional regulator [Demequina sp. PMTSA13]WNM27819.1 PucR family transcriptional regulator [Demequina sp. PMTSA13]
MPTTLATLLQDAPLGLSLKVPGRSEALTEPLAWAHASDLADPTPWLVEGGLLLTDGVQFRDDASAQAATAYVDRLTTRGVLALGFAEGIVHPQIPATVVDACARVEMPLLKVPRGTPFMQIIRHVSDAIARDERSRLEASLDAQRAVARAALRPDGLRAILAELEVRLGTWVALFDASGERVEIATRLNVPADASSIVEEAARRLLAKGRPGTIRLDDEGLTATLETIGRRAPLRGVLAVGSAGDLDSAGADLVSSVIALAGIALEQSRTLETARRRLRAGILELLRAGAFQVAESTASALWGSLPQGPVVVTMVAPEGTDTTLTEQLETFADRHQGRVFFAERDGALVLVAAQGDERLALPFLERAGLRAGMSGPISWTELDRGLDEARRAWASASASRPVAKFPELARRGMLSYLEEAGGEAVARRLLAPLLGDPADAQLIEAAGVWLENLGQWDPAARALGIHRQTLRSRVAVAGRRLGLDLERVDDRTELWTALTLTRMTPADRV